MKKQVIKALSLFLVCVCFICLYAPSVLAASTTSSKSYTGSSGGGKSHYIYVKTNDTDKSKSVKLTFTKGELKTSDTNDKTWKGLVKSKKLYASYEIKISYRSGSTWKQETSYDVYNKDTKTVTLKKSNTYYRIQVYQWRASTTLTSYYNNSIWRYSSNSTYVDNPYWSTLPKFKVGSATRTTIYTGNPF